MGINKKKKKLRAIICFVLLNCTYILCDAITLFTWEYYSFHYVYVGAKFEFIMFISYHNYTVNNVIIFINNMEFLKSIANNKLLLSNNVYCGA